VQIFPSVLLQMTNARNGFLALIISDPDSLLARKSLIGPATDCRAEKFRIDSLAHENAKSFRAIAFSSIWMALTANRKNVCTHQIFHIT
jgi:hypothetical protein